MPDNPSSTSDFSLAEPAEFARNLAKALEHASRIAGKLADRPDLAKRETEAQVTPLDQVAKTLSSVISSYAADPQKLMNAQMQLWTGYGELWQAAWKRFLGDEAEPVVTPERNDRRFTDRDWKEHAFFDFLKQFYLISARWAVDLVKNAEGIDEHTRHKARFYVEQIVNALSPSNFGLTNPEVLRATLASNGANIVEGLKHLEADLEKGNGLLRIKQTDTTGFEVGRDLATTPGKVVFENDTLQLIQYEPATGQVYEIPLLIVP